MLKNLSNILKKNLLGVITFIVFAMILVSYFKVYIPKQEQEINSAKFRVLSRIRGNVRNKIYGLKSQITLLVNKKDSEIGNRLNYLKKDTNTRIFDSGMNDFKTYIDENKSLPLQINEVSATDTANIKYLRFSTVAKGFLMNLGYVRGKSSCKTYKTLDVAKSWKDFINDQLRNDFESYMIIRDSTLLYASDSSLGVDMAGGKLIVSNNVDYNHMGVKNFDSVYFQSHFHFITPSIDDIYIDGQNYKIFSFPIRLNAQGVMFICGLIKASTYSAATKRIPGNIAYFIGILVLIFILLFPFLKLIFMGESEMLGTTDFLMGIGSIMLLCIALTTAITLLIENYSQNYKYTLRYNNNLNYSMQTRFKDELDAAIGRLKKADSILKAAYSNANYKKDTDKYLALQPPTDIKKNMWDSNLILLKDKSDLKHQLLNTDNNEYAWFDFDGKRETYWKKIAISVPWGYFSSRPYFIHAKNKEGNYIPEGVDTDKFYMEPLISWTTGQFETDISMHSNVPGKCVVSTSINLQSYFPFIPLGYGYNIIDDKGNVQYSSDSLKNLNENMIQECDDSAGLIGAIHSRTKETFSVNYHNESINCIISPIAGTPYFIVTYNSNSFASQRLWYTMLFSYPCMIVLFLFATLLLLLISIFRRKNSDHNLKATHMHFDWLWPNVSKKREYLQILLFNIFVVILTAGFFSVPFIRHSQVVKENYSLFLLYICCLNVLFSLGILYYLLHGADAKTNHTWVWFSFLLIIVLIDSTALIFYHFLFFLWITIYILLLFGNLRFAKYLANKIRKPKNMDADSGSPHVEIPSNRDKEILSGNFKKQEVFIKSLSGETSITTLCTWIFVSWMLISCIIPCYYFINYSYNQINVRQLKEYQLYFAAKYNPAKDYNYKKTKCVSGTGSDSLSTSPVKDSEFEASQLGNDTLYKKIVVLTSMVINPDQNMALALGKDYSEENSKNRNEKSRVDTLNSYNWFENKNHDRLIFSYFPAPSGSQKAGFQIISPLQKFINPLKEVKYFLVFILMMLIIYGLTRFLFNRFYKLGFIQAPDEQLTRLMDMLENRSYKNILISGIPLSGRLDLITNRLESLYGKERILEIKSFINSDYIDAKDKLTAELLDEKFPAADFTNQYDVVLVRRFEYNIKDLVTNRIKLNLVERLLNLPGQPRIIIIPDTEPISALQSALSFDHHNMEEAIKKEMQGDLDRWTILLTQFHNVYFYIRNEPILDNALPGWAKEVIHKECNLGVFMPEIAGMLENDVKTNRAKDSNEVIWLAQSYSRLYYHSLWNSFAKEEKYIVYDLALDGLLNTKNANLINILHQKGIFFTDKKKGNITLFNDSFRNFILTEISKEEIDSMNQLAKKKGEWSNFKSPIIIIIIFMLVLLTISNGTSVVSYITMLVTGLSLLQRVFGGLSTLGITAVPATK